ADIKIQEVNDAGGIDGRMVELVVFDDKMDPKEAANCAQLIAGDETILACIGSYSTSCCLAAVPIFQKADLAMITPSASSEDLVKDNTVMYKMWSSIPVYVSALANWLV